MRIQPNLQDRWIWKGDVSGLYLEGSRLHLLNEVVADENDDGAFTIIWKMKIPSKVAHFVRGLVRDRLPKRANLRRRNVMLDDYFCPFCSSIPHFFWMQKNNVFFGGRALHGQKL